MPTLTQLWTDYSSSPYKEPTNISVHLHR